MLGSGNKLNVSYYAQWETKITDLTGLYDIISPLNYSQLIPLEHGTKPQVQKERAFQTVAAAVCLC